jgi:hypothetical protein
MTGAGGDPPAKPINFDARGNFPGRPSNSLTRYLP